MIDIIELVAPCSSNNNTTGMEKINATMIDHAREIAKEIVADAVPALYRGLIERGGLIVYPSGSPIYGVFDNFRVILDVQIRARADYFNGTGYIRIFGKGRTFMEIEKTRRG